jgi:hypothetical protein
MNAVSTIGLVPEERFVCVVLHDVAASTRAACMRTLAAIAEVAAVRNAVKNVISDRRSG